MNPHFAMAGLVSHAALPEAAGGPLLACLFENRGLPQPVRGLLSDGGPGGLCAGDCRGGRLLSLWR